MVPNSVTLNGVIAPKFALFHPILFQAHCLKPSDHVRLLGVSIAADLGLGRHVSNVRKTCFFWLWQPETCSSPKI